MVKYGWGLAMLLAGCAGSANTPDGYDIAGSVSVMGAQGSETIDCGDAGIVTGHGCVVNGGSVAGERIDGGSFECIGSVANVAKGATIIAWAECL